MLYFGLAIFAVYIVFKLLYLLVPPFCTKRLNVGGQASTYRSFAVLVPAFNEKDVIINCLKSLINLHYPNYSVFIINDGSYDETFDVLNKFLSLYSVHLKENGNLSFERISSKCRSQRYPNIFVINKKNGGKADALNAGIACCRADYVVTLDADCMLRENALSVMNRAFADKSVIAAGGAVHIVQSIKRSAGQTKLTCRIKNVIKFQTMQYLTAFYLHKCTQSLLNALIVISGAFGAFRRDVLIDVCGYRKSVGEDMDITLKIHHYIKRQKKKLNMLFVPQSVCYTECPENMRNLTKQRIRWQKAFVDCLVHYGTKMFRHFKPSISMFFVFDALLLGTITAVMILIVPVLVIIQNQTVWLFIIFFGTDFLLGIVEGIMTIKVCARYGNRYEKRDWLRVGAFIPFQLLTYRFLNIFFVLFGTASYIKNKDHWNKAERLGRTISLPVRWEQKAMFNANVTRNVSHPDA